ncbi:hypothetical protein ACBQ88_21025 [Citrobacter braakii]|uniref:hypothetical protein n=1 Tax=Citrobacter braakii TaxID=57706 RepID=UPI003523AD84
MEVLNGVIEGDISPNHDITIKGILNGTLIVNGVYADVHGVVNGDVIVNNGGSVNIYGTVQGGITNNSGLVTVAGMVGREVSTVYGDTKILPDAVTNFKE